MTSTLNSKKSNKELARRVIGSSTWHCGKVFFSDGSVGIVRNKDNTYKQNIMFPCVSALASTCDSTLAYKLGRALAQQINSGVVLFPSLNIKRNPYNGRNFEYLSEDPILNGIMGYQLVQGIQSKTNVASCIKHFAFNNQENYRCTSSSNLDEKTAFNIYLKAWEIVFKAKPKLVMMAYNKFNSTYCTESEYLMNLARSYFNFEGVFVSDWDAVSSPYDAIKNGLDIIMSGPNECFVKQIESKLESGYIKESTILDRIDKIEKLEASLNILEKENRMFKEPLFLDLALEIEIRSIVLLKNEDNILPLKPDQNVNIFGLLAVNPVRQGYGSSKILNILPVKDDLDINYHNYLQCYDEIGNKTADFENISQIISKDDINILFVGNLMETEAIDRKTLNLSSLF